MSIFVLLSLMWIALILSNVLDGLSLWGWIRIPQWMLWTATIALVAWCMDSDDPPVD